MGLLLLQTLRHSGSSQVVVVEPQPDRLVLARQLGAAAAVPPEPDELEGLRELAPYGFAIVVDATGIPSVIEQAFNYLKPRGRFLQFGVTQMDATISLRPYDIFRHDWTIIGTFAICYTFQRAIAWLSGGICDVEPLVSHTLSLDDFPVALKSFAAGETLKVHLRP
jgi:threonine dehydrogenase-like Zn-dependent dehydrogenase